MGKIRQDNKPRPLRVVLESTNDKFKCLKNAPKIRSAQGLSFNANDVFILPDMTKLERDEDTKLREALKKKRESSPNSKWIIRAKKIVQKTDQSSVLNFQGGQRGPT